MVGTEDDRRVLPEVVLVDGGEDVAEPAVDHRELSAVAGPKLARAPVVKDALADAADDVGRPDEVRPFPVGVVHRGIGLRGIERLVRVELVYEQEEAIVVWRIPVEPLGCCAHHLRAGEVLLASKVATRVVVRHPGPAERGRPGPARIGPCLPRVTLVPAFIVPRGEVGVVVLAAGFEEVRVVRNKVRCHAVPSEWHGERFFPDLDRAPRPPEEVQRAHQNVVSCRHARQRARVVFIEAHGTLGEPVEVRRLELGTAVGPEHVPVQRVEEDDDRVLRRCG